uniref:Uncharacterized protein n=1 Tax=Rhizophora mucronata TaxID=61149 RepID=A0A2P2LPJ2_RHIMU
MHLRHLGRSLYFKGLVTPYTKNTREEYSYGTLKSPISMNIPE